MITEEFKIYADMFEDVVDIKSISNPVPSINLKVDLSFLKKYISYIKSLSLVEPPHYLISELQFYEEFERYYIKTLNVKKEVKFDPNYKAHLELLKSKIKVLQIVFTKNVKNFVYHLDLESS